jgi:hypothetical protein
MGGKVAARTPATRNVDSSMWEELSIVFVEEGTTIPISFGHRLGLGTLLPPVK